MLSDGIPRSLEDILQKYGQRLDRLERKPRGATGDEIPTATTYAQPTPPTPPIQTGSLWIDTDNENQMYRWDGTKWVLYRDAGIQRVEIDAASTLLVSKMDFEAASDNLVTTYWQATGPVSPSGPGDLWVDTDDKKLYRWSGSTWVDMNDTSVGQALSTSGMVNALGDSRIKTFFTFGQPIAEGIGDLWADTDDGNKLYRWTGTVWTPVLQDLTAQSSATAAILLNNYSTNPIFDNWLASDAAPVGYTVTSGTVNPVKETTRIRTAPYAIRWEVDDVTPAGITTDGVTPGAWDTTPNSEYLTITIDLQLVSGSLSGAGLVVDWLGLTPTQRVIVNLADDFTLGVTPGKWYRLTKVIKRPAAAPGGTFTKVAATLYANSSVIGPLAAKDIVFDQLSVRKTTAEEITVYGQPAGTIGQQLPDITGNKITTFYVASTDPPTAQAVGDLWWVIDKSNLLRRWDGSLWIDLQVGTGALDPGSVDGPILSGDIQLTSTIRTAASGARLELDGAGFRQYSTSEALKTHFPAADDAPNRFAGDVEAESLTVKDGATLQGTSEIYRDSGMTLTSGITAPVQAPGLSIEYDYVTPPTNVLKNGPLGDFALNPNEVSNIYYRSTGVFVIYQGRSNGTRGWLVNPDGTLNGDGFFDLPRWDMYGEVEYAGNTHILVRNQNNGVTYVGRMNSMNPPDGFFNTYARLNTTRTPVLSKNASSLIVGESHPTTNAFTVRPIHMSATSYGAATIDPAVISTPISTGGSWSGLLYGNFDYGAARYVAAMHATPYDIWPINTSGTIVQPEQFPSPTSNKRGLAWDGTNFWIYSNDGKLYKMSTLTWTTESPTWWVANTWQDTVGTLHETNLGAKRSIVMKRRAKLKVTLPAIPGSGGAEEPNGWAVYLARNATAPADSAMHLQFAGSTASTFIVTPSWAGIAPPISNNFPGSNPGYMESATLSTVDSSPKFWVDGSGAGRWEGEDWHVVGAVGEPAFQSGYFAASGYPVQYRKDPLGNVHVRGVAWTGGAVMGTPSTIFTLPIGYRPIGTTAYKFIQDAEQSGAVRTAIALIYVDNNGLVVYPWAKAGTPNTVRLDFIFSTR